MPFFFIIPVWILCLLAGTTLFCFHRVRDFSMYVLLGSTGFTVFSFLCSTPVLPIAVKSLQLFWHSGLLTIGGYIGALIAGGVFGAVGGLTLACKLNFMRHLARPVR
jgi:hypothetical protein